MLPNIAGTKDKVY